MIIHHSSETAGIPALPSALIGEEDEKTMYKKWKAGNFPSNPREHLLLSMNGESTLHLCPLCWAEMVGIFTVSQTAKQRTSSTAEAKESSSFPSLCSYIHGRKRPFSFSNLTANFHDIPLLSQTVVIPKAQLRMYRNKARSNSFFRKPSVESPNPPSHSTEIPQAHPRL